VLGSQLLRRSTLRMRDGFRCRAAYRPALRHALAGRPTPRRSPAPHAAGRPLSTPGRRAATQHERQPQSPPRAAASRSLLTRTAPPAAAATPAFSHSPPDYTQARI
jgi:hypothetical protein